MAREQRLTLSAILLLAALLWAGGPAIAHHKADHTKGKVSTGVTEDNDDDGVSNTPDPFGDADNRHPSGKDKHAEGGASGNQGKSASDPDDDGRGPDRGNGLDKPGGDGGLDPLDQDGNNGCGNDDDFEDDNEGWCLGPVKARGEVVVAAGGEIAQPEVAGDVAVLGEGIQGEAPGAEVLGAGAEVEAGAIGGGALATTGASSIPLATAGLGLLAAGAGLLRVTRRR